MITLTGFLILASSVALILWYDVTLSLELPRWIYTYAGLSLFLYQTLDAIDGKQALLTRSANALGHFFDHGCDVFACTCLVVIGCQLLRLGNSSLSLVFQCALSVSADLKTRSRSSLSTGSICTLALLAPASGTSVSLKVRSLFISRTNHRHRRSPPHRAHRRPYLEWDDKHDSGGGDIVGVSERLTL